MRKLWLAGAIALGALACGGAMNAGVGEVVVAITAQGLNQDTVRLPGGGSVTFANQDSRTHEITSVDRFGARACPTVHTGRLAPRATATVTVPEGATCVFEDTVTGASGQIFTTPLASPPPPGDETSGPDSSNYK